MSHDPTLSPVNNKEAPSVEALADLLIQIHFPDGIINPKRLEDLRQCIASSPTAIQGAMLRTVLWLLQEVLERQIRQVFPEFRRK